MKKWLLLVLISYVCHYKWFRKKLLQRIEKISRHKNLLLHIGAIRRSGFATISISGMDCTDKDQFTIQTAGIEITGVFKNIFSRKKPVLVVRVNQLQVTVEHKPGNPNAESPPSSGSATAYIENYILRLCNLLRPVIHYLPDQTIGIDTSVTINKEQVLHCFSAILDCSQRTQHQDMHAALLQLSLVDCRIKSLFIDSIRISSHLEYDAHGFTITEASHGYFNSIPFRFYARCITSGERMIQLAAGFNQVTVAELTASMPFLRTQQLLHTNLPGTINLRILFTLQLDKPYHHTFTAEFDNKLGSFLHPTEIFNYLEYPFAHPVLDSIAFIPLTEIAPHLVQALICTEDPRFYEHKGVDASFIGSSLAANLLERKFARGGSTITMQLARNLFLHHQKTIARKLEEILIAWTMEVISNVSKERILELYLNIIEWGPGIYGIAAASNFYFAKQPHELSLTESLVLTYIIPRPKHFVEALSIRSEQLQQNLSKHIRQFSRVMLKKGLITEQELNDIEHTIEFAHEQGSVELVGRELLR